MAAHGLLVRVGIDSSCGSWNAPCDLQARSFAYVPIPESKRQWSSCVTLYNAFTKPLNQFGRCLPPYLVRQPVHCDPDFRYMTYGDQGRRAHRIRRLVEEAPEEAFLVFYASLRDVRSANLVYALIGFFWISDLLEATKVSRCHWHQNAHTRRRSCDGDIVIRADQSRSGRLAQLIPVGKFRDRAYRIDRALLNAWGGLDVADGYVQRSAYLPRFRNGGRFLAWFSDQKPDLLSRNN